MTKLLCVYCSSSDRLDAKYYAAATELGHELVARGWGLVYGGGKTGLMGAVARAVKEKGGKVVGVIPEFMKVRELAFAEADELISVVTMRERKLLMEARADAFVTLPGGFGTLDELFEALTLMQTGKVPYGPVILVGTVFWGGLMCWIQEQLTGNRLINSIDPKTFFIADEPKDVVAHLLDFYKEHPDILKLQPNRAV